MNTKAEAECIGHRRKRHRAATNSKHEFCSTGVPALWRGNGGTAGGKACGRRGSAKEKEKKCAWRRWKSGSIAREVKPGFEFYHQNKKNLGKRC